MKTVQFLEWIKNNKLKLFYRGSIVMAEVLTP